MIYPILNTKIPGDKRAEINDQIILSIAKGKKNISNTEIYNTYTGIGGLHDLDINDFSNYHEYSSAKKAFEMGQFFTPHEICKQMVELVTPEPADMVLDMCCGMGNFFNFLPNLYNAYGFDIDENAVKVAKRLYPEANIEVDDLRFYDPKTTFDIILGNPPFNLDFEGIRSQHFFTHKAYWLLKPGGIMLLIMPKSYLASESMDRTYISMINRDFTFIGQTNLPSSAFKDLGVADFETKIMAFMRNSESLPEIPYQPDAFVSLEELKQKLDEINLEKKKQRLKLLRETRMIAEGSLESRLKKYKASKEDIKKKGKSLKVTQKDIQLNILFKSMSCHEGKISFERTLEKYLYELKTHKLLMKHYPKMVAYVSKFRNQQPPMNCTQEKREHWEKHIKITPDQVLKKLRYVIKRQNVKAQKKYRLVRTQYGYKLKNYTNPISQRSNKYVPFYDLIANGVSLPAPKKMTPKLEREYKQAEKILAKKKREFAQENAQFEDMQRNSQLDEYIDQLTFIGMKQTQCVFSEVQKKDIGFLFQKRYNLLNWQPGSGKTAVLYHFGKYHLAKGHVKNIVIVAPSNAKNMTWDLFLKYNKEEYYTISEPEHLNNVPTGKIVILSVSFLGKVEKKLRQFMKKNSNKICLLFDESDELTCDDSLRTKRTLKCLRRAKYKMLGTGTTTRNYIHELYSQLQLMYNSSVNFMCYCREKYYEYEKGQIRMESNSYYRKPFPIRRGASLFKACFNPSKASVFGIDKHNQDVYNQDSLQEIIGKAILTRKFKDFAGDKYTIHNKVVTPASGEREVFKKIIKEFHSIYKLYFSSTGDKRKDSSLELVRQIQLLIKSCSVPHLMPGYSGDTLPQKALYIKNMVQNITEKVAIGCISLDTLNFYEKYFSEEFSHRPLFIIKGDINFRKRLKIIRDFENTTDGILISTQQSLKSSVNIPSCNEVILESLQWNIPRMEQFYFRFIRFDSEEHTNVHFVNYSNSIEQNLMALILQKERLNDFIRAGEVTEESSIFDEFGVSTSVIESLFTREQDEEGKFYIAWGEQKFVS